MKEHKLGNIKQWFSSLKKKEYVLLVVFVLVLVAVVVFWNTSATTTSNNQNQTSETIYKDLTNVQAYSEFVEHRLEQVLSSIKGAGNAKVFVVVESGVTLITEDSAHEDESNTSSSIWGSSSSVHNYVIQQKSPELKGILIVCEGAKDVRLKLTISQAISAIFDIDEAHISILEGTGV